MQVNYYITQARDEELIPSSSRVCLVKKATFAVNLSDCGFYFKFPTLFNRCKY